MVTGEFCPYPDHDDYENELRSKRRLHTYVNELGLFIWSQTCLLDQSGMWTWPEQGGYGHITLACLSTLFLELVGVLCEFEVYVLIGKTGENLDGI